MASTRSLAIRHHDEAKARLTAHGDALVSSPKDPDHQTCDVQENDYPLCSCEGSPSVTEVSAKLHRRGPDRSSTECVHLQAGRGVKEPPAAGEGRNESASVLTFMGSVLQLRGIVGDDGGGDVWQPLRDEAGNVLLFNGENCTALHCTATEWLQRVPVLHRACLTATCRHAVAPGRGARTH